MGKQLGATRQVPSAIGVNILARKYSHTHTLKTLPKFILNYL